MALTTSNLLPSGMRERTFAMRNVTGNTIIRFGRGTEFPASEYTFPAIDANTESYRRQGSHSTTFGTTSLTPDFFEAKVGALEPNSAGKLERLAGVWNLPNYRRRSGDRHELFYVLGGRARMMYGKPSRIAFTHHGYKTSYHEALLRFAVSDPFFYSAEEITVQANHSAVPAAANRTHTEPIPEALRTQIPTPAVISISATNMKKVIVHDSARTMLELDNVNGTFLLENFPGFSRTTYIPNGGPLSSGADIISPRTPPFQDCVIDPFQENVYVQVTAGTSSGSCAATIKWRNAYASP